MQLRAATFVLSLVSQTLLSKGKIIRGVVSGWRNVRKESLVKCNVLTSVSKH